ncbi:MAG: MurR/RpiR family transcriptional regulator [Chloroflexota bacterium]
MELLKKIQSRYSSLSKNQKKIADYLGNTGIEVSFDSITELSHKVGVSESSIVRFAKELGYKGYPNFRKELQAEFRRTSGAASRFRDALTSISGQNVIDSVFKADIQLIEETRSALSETELAQAVHMITSAKKILIIGFRAAFSLAYFLYFRFVRLHLDARLVALTGGTSLVEQLALLKREDLLIALGFDEMPRETRIAIDFALKNRIPVLGISHIPTSEIGRKSTLCLFGRRRPHRTQSLAGSMALLNALAIAVATHNKGETLRALRRLDSIEQQYLHDILRRRK